MDPCQDSLPPRGQSAGPRDLGVRWHGPPAPARASGCWSRMQHSCQGPRRPRRRPWTRRIPAGPMLDIRGHRGPPICGVSPQSVSRKPGTPDQGSIQRHCGAMGAVEQGHGRRLPLRRAMARQLHRRGRTLDGQRPGCHEVREGASCCRAAETDRDRDGCSPCSPGGSLADAGAAACGTRPSAEGRVQSLREAAGHRHDGVRVQRYRVDPHLDQEGGEIRVVTRGLTADPDAAPRR